MRVLDSQERLIYEEVDDNISSTCRMLLQRPVPDPYVILG